MRRKWMLPAAAVGLSLITTLVVIGYLQSLRKGVTRAAPVKTEAVVFARRNIAQRQIVSGDALELRQVPLAAVHPQAIRRLESAANRVAVAPIFADEQVLQVKLAPVGTSAGLSYVLPKGKRAMTVGVNEVIGVAGFVVPGDRVDVVATVTVKDESFTKVVLQDVEVLALAQNVEQKPGEKPRVTTSATLALTPEQTEVLAQTDTSGKVRLALRPYGVSDVVPTPGKTVETAMGWTVPLGGQGTRVASTPRPAMAAMTAALAAADSALRSVPTLRAAPVRAVAPAAPRPAAAAPTVKPPYSVEVWRGTTKTAVRVEDARQ